MWIERQPDGVGVSVDMGSTSSSVETLLRKGPEN